MASAMYYALTYGSCNFARDAAHSDPEHTTAGSDFNPR